LHKRLIITGGFFGTEVESYGENAETMITNLPNKFLQEKISQLQSALFFPEHDSALKLPTHVISAAEADAEGQIWFMIPKPSQHINAFDREFPAKLDFFKKGKGFYLKIQGKASIVTCAEQPDSIIPEVVRERLRQEEVVAIKIKVQNADYFENVPKTSSNWIQNSTSLFMNWLLNPRYDQQNPQLVTIPIPVER